MDHLINQLIAYMEVRSIHVLLLCLWNCVTVINYTVGADVLQHQTRVHFVNNDKDVYSGSLSMTSQHCDTQMLKLIVSTPHTTYHHSTTYRLMLLKSHF